MSTSSGFDSFDSGPPPPRLMLSYLSGKIIGSNDNLYRMRLVNVLGSGGYAVVYRAINLMFSSRSQPRYFAVKCINNPGPTRSEASRRAAIENEISLHTAASPGPNILKLHTVIRNDREGHTYLVMEYGSEGDLFSSIKFTEQFRRNETLAKSVFLQIIESVTWLHRKQIYHRDLKPENIICAADGKRVLLADFGLATRRLITSDFGLGSPNYMSPESQKFFGDEVMIDSAKCDIWALGVILINLITQNAPWIYAHAARDPCFASYLGDPDFIARRFPITPETNVLLKRIFRLNPNDRINISDLKREVKKIDHFVMSPGQAIKNRLSRVFMPIQPYVRFAVGWKKARPAPPCAAKPCTFAANRGGLDNLPAPRSGAESDDSQGPITPELNAQDAVCVVDPVAEEIELEPATRTESDVRALGPGLVMVTPKYHHQNIDRRRRGQPPNPIPHPAYQSRPYRNHPRQPPKMAVEDTFVRHPPRRPQTSKVIA